MKLITNETEEKKLLKETSKRCIEIMEELDIPIAQNVYFIINSRAKSRYGQCRRIHSWDNEFEIQVSDMVLDKEVPIKSLETVILHELLHTVEGCMNHGAKWKALANKINKAYGYEIERTSNREKLGIKEDKTVNYKFECTCCGQEITRTRRSRFVDNYSYYRCGRCKGSFKRVL